MTTFKLPSVHVPAPVAAGPSTAADSVADRRFAPCGRGGIGLLRIGIALRLPGQTPVAAGRQLDVELIDLHVVFGQPLAQGGQVIQQHVAGLGRFGLDSGIEHPARNRNVDPQ